MGSLAGIYSKVNEQTLLHFCFTCARFFFLTHKGWTKNLRKYCVFKPRIKLPTPWIISQDEREELVFLVTAAAAASHSQRVISMCH